MLSGKFMKFGGKTYHPQHFVCAEPSCRTPLASARTGQARFRSIAGKPYCAKHAEALAQAHTCFRLVASAVYNMC